MQHLSNTSGNQFGGSGSAAALLMRHEVPILFISSPHRAILYPYPLVRSLRLNTAHLVLVIKFVDPVNKSRKIHERWH